MPLDTAHWRQAVETFAAQGQRVLAFAALPADPARETIDEAALRNLCTQAIIGAKEGATTAIRKEVGNIVTDAVLRTADGSALAGVLMIDMRNGGFVFVDDCNHDIDGLFAKSFEAQMAGIFGAAAMKKLPNDHPLYSSFFKFDGPPATSFELNGWGDDLIHDYLKGITINGRLGVLYSNKDYGCEWDYDWRNKRFLAEDNTRFGVNIIMYALSN